LYNARFRYAALSAGAFSSIIQDNILDQLLTRSNHFWPI
jgi:hypothetical protein